MPLREDLLRELDALIQQGNGVAASFYMGDTAFYGSRLDEHVVRAFLVAGAAAIVRIAGRDSEFARQLPPPVGERHASGMPSHAQGTLAALVALRSAVEGGLLGGLEQRIRANVHDDFLVQSDELLTANFHVAAMVLIGGVLEDHLRRLCDARQRVPQGRGSLSTYNDALRDHVYPQPTWRRIQGIGDVRNLAAHGQGAQVQRPDVDDARQFVGRFLAEYPT